jgi:hypothetical protein
MNSSSQLCTPALSPNIAFNGVFPIEFVCLAIESAKHSPQYRFPRGRQGGPWKTVHSSFKIRHHPTYLNNFVVILEGRLEGDHALGLEFDSPTEAYSCQPFKLLGSEELGFESFIPDFVVYPFNAPAYLVDCKPKSVAEAKIHKDRHKVLKKALELYGVELKIETDDIIQQQPRLNTYKFLYTALSAHKEELLDACRQVIQATVKLGGCTDVKELRYLGTDVVRRGIAYGLSVGALASDFDVEYGPNALIHITTDKE